MRRWIPGLLACFTAGWLIFSPCAHADPPAPSAPPPPSASAAIVIDPTSPRVTLLKQIHLITTPEDQVPAAIDASRYRLAIIDGTPANLQTLQQHARDLDHFTAAGGWVMLWGVTPDGLATFDQLVGIDHLMRPFRMEKVAATESPSPLSAGIVSNDLAMESNKRTPAPASVPYLSDDAWSYVVDLHDIAPFCELPSPEHWGNPTAQLGWDSWPGNMVNGIDDYWRFSFTISLAKPQYSDWTMKLPRKESIDGFSIVRESIFSRVTEVHLSFPGGAAKPIDLDVTQDARQDFSFPPVDADSVEIALDTDRKNKVVTGVRNIWLHVARPADFDAHVRPLASIGVLVAYPRGAGGIVLNELNVPAAETEPANAAKKQAILNALLRNLHAPFDPKSPVPMRKVEWAQKGIAWEDPANWLGGEVPGKGDIACFPGAFNSVATVDPIVSKPAKVGGLEFDDDFGGAPIPPGHELAPGVKSMGQRVPSWIVSGPGNLSVGAGGIDVAGHCGSDLITCDLELADSQTWHVGGGYWDPNVLIHDQYGNPFNLVLTGALSGPGAWIKEGTGRVYYANNSSPAFTGGLTVRGTAVEWALSKLPAGGAYQFGSGPITLDDGSFCFGANKTRTKFTVEITNPIFVTPKNGMLEISAERMGSFVPPLVRYTGPVHLAGNLKLAHSTLGGGESGLDVAGPILLDQSAPRTLGLAMGDFVTGWIVFPIVRGDLHDEPTPPGGQDAGNPLVLRSLINSFLITGKNSDYAEDTCIDACGSRLFGGSADAMVVAGPGALFGKGNILLEPGGHLNLSDSSNVSANQTVTLRSDAASLSVLGLRYNGLPAISKDSTGVIGIETKEFDAISDLSKVGDGTMRLGTFGGGTFSGQTLAPGAGNLYRLGGGGSGRFVNTAALHIQGPALTGSGGVEVGSTSWWGNGNVELDGANTFTGPLVVQSPAPQGEYEVSFVTSLTGIAQTAAGASPFGSPQGSVLVDNAVLQLSARPGTQPVTKGTLTTIGLGDIVLAGNANLTFADFQRQNRAVLTVEGANPKSPASAPHLHIASWQKPVTVLDPYVLWGNDFASYDPTNGLSPFGGYVTDIAKAGGDDMLRLGATALTGQTIHVKSLKATSPITGKGTFVLSGGGLIATGDFQPNVDFGGAEGIVHGPCNLLGKISGKNGLTLAEPMNFDRAMIELVNPANDFVGPITANNAVILVRFDTQGRGGKDIPGSLGDLHNDIFLNGSFINRYQSNGPNELAASRTIILGPSGGGFFFGYQPETTSHIRARITGPGMLTQFIEDGHGLTIDNPDNDYSGGTKVVAGQNNGMTAGPTGKLGTGPVLIDPESQLILQGDNNVDPHARLEVALGGIARCTSDHPAFGSLTGAGTVYLDGKPAAPATNTALMVGSDDSNFTFLGSIIQEGAAPAGVIKLGSGVWTLFGAQHYKGPTMVMAGTLELHGSLDSNALSVGPAGTLRARGSISGDLEFSPNSTFDIPPDAVGLHVAGRVAFYKDTTIRFAPAVPPTAGSRLTVLTADKRVNADDPNNMPDAPKGYQLVLSADKKTLELVKQ